MEKIFERKLANGIVLSYYDESRRMAGDRWIVKLRFGASMPLSDDMLTECAGSDEESVYIREQFNGKLAFEMDMEKVFVDQDDKDGVLKELLERAEQNLRVYLEKESFVTGLLAKKISEYKERYICRPPEVVCQHLEADDEPADFSDCFK